MLISLSEAAREAKVDRRTIRRLIQSGRLRALDFGNGTRRLYRIDPADLRAITSKSIPTAPPTPISQPRRRRRRSASSPSVSQFLPSI